MICTPTNLIPVIISLLYSCNTDVTVLVNPTHHPESVNRATVDKKASKVKQGLSLSLSLSLSLPPLPPSLPSSTKVLYHTNLLPVILFSCNTESDITVLENPKSSLVVSQDKTTSSVSAIKSGTPRLSFQSMADERNVTESWHSHSTIYTNTFQLDKHSQANPRHKSVGSKPSGIFSSKYLVLRSSVGDS